MLSKKSEITFYSLLMAALMLAPAQAFVLAGSMRTADALARKHPVSLIQSLAGWTRVIDSDDLEKPEVLLRNYRNGDRKLVVVARQASLYNFIHDLYFCLTSNESQVTVIGKRQYDVGGDRLNATLIEDADSNSAFLTLLWFQNGSISAADRNDWRLAMLKHPSIMGFPLCRNVRVSVSRSADRAADEKLLIAASRALFKSPF